MTHAPLLVDAEELEAFIVAVFDRLGMPPAIAELTAELMVQTDLRGVDSHGVAMLPKYLEWIRAGFIVPAAEPKVVRDEGPTALVDGNQAMGHYTATAAMEMAIAKARAHGVGFVAVRNSNHFGACALYSMKALAYDMIGLAFTNSPAPAMVPTFGRKAMLATNPLSLAAPAGREPSFVLDMATTTVAIGRLALAGLWERPIPEGWALDPSGRPTTDPAVALASRLLTPLGGSRELGGHKGYGLGLLVDILSGVLPGAVYGDLYFRSDLKDRRTHVGHLFGAIEIARFRPVEEFKAAMDDLLGALKASPKAEGETRIYVAGEPEFECEARRRREGIPLPPRLVAQLEEIAASLGLAFALGRG